MYYIYSILEVDKFIQVCVLFGPIKMPHPASLTKYLISYEV